MKDIGGVVRFDEAKFVKSVSHFILFCGEKEIVFFIFDFTRPQHSADAVSFCN